MREGATTESKRPTAGDSVTQVEPPAVHRPLAMEVALDDEIERLERMVLLAWQATAVVGVLVGLCVFLVVPGFKLDAMLLTPLLFLVWFHGVTYLPKGGPAERITRTWLTPAVESAVPWVALLPIMHANGPQYALGSWVPPMLYGFVTSINVLRLRPSAPLIAGLCGAAQYWLVYAFSIRHQLSAEAIAMPLYSPKMQVVRSLSIVLSAGTGAVLAYGIRHAIARAAKTVRTQDLFGKYRIERIIATGGMATVYAATYCPEGGFARPVAIKRIHEHLAREGAFVDAFRNEAELCARLVHPNIVQVLDFGRVDQNYFLAMEFVEGVTLSALMSSLRARGESLSPSVVAWVGREMLQGLAYSHGDARDEAGRVLRVVHRDLSPQNVLLSKNGQVKIADFGLARALRSARSYMTESIVGHISYMAPEQGVGEEIDERADLFGTGVILWELLAGAPLFKRSNDAATLLAIMQDPVPPISLRRSDLGNAPWQEFLARATEREVEKRFATAREMCTALEGILARIGMPQHDELARLVAHAATHVVDREEHPTVVEAPAPAATSVA
jgi:eukaryotic-like serine/threonine-protein kinase